MANYLATIELHSAEAEDYERLHRSMEQRGYVRKVPGDDGITYQLPKGCYFANETSALMSVALGAAVDAAKETGRGAAVMVTDWQAARWSGLTKG